MSEGKSINIFIRTNQTDAEGKKSDMEFFVEGSYIQKGHTEYITYKESELAGMEGTTTTIKISPNCLSIIRFGSITTKLDFILGAVTSSIYATPYGQLDISIDTKLLGIDINEDGKSTIELKYTLDSGTEQILNNEMFISFERADT